MAFLMYSKGLVLRDVGRTSARLHLQSLFPWQASVPRPTSHAKATIRTMELAGQEREISDPRRKREEIIAAVDDSRPGAGSMLREEDENTVKVARPPKGHKYWGLTIFRCTYKDDEAWSQLMKLIREHVYESTEYYGAPDLMESLNLKVFEDPSVLEGASTTLVRKKFLEWRSGPAVEQEIVGTDGYPLLIPNGSGRTHGTKPRYQFFVQVDEESLYSNISRETKAPLEYAVIRGHVNLIRAEWELPDPKERAKLLQMDAEAEDPLDEDEEPLEGCKIYDVGWMKANITVFDVGAQSYLNDTLWDVNYVRPPGIVQTF